MKKKRKRYHRKRLIFIVVVVALLICTPFIRNVIHPKMYIASDTDQLSIKVHTMQGDEAYEQTIKIARGSRVEVREKGEDYSRVEYEGYQFTISNDYLVDHLEDCIQIDYVYPRRLLNLYKAKNGELSDVVVKKSEKLEVVSCDVEDLDTSTGSIRWYQIKKGKKNYWISGNYVETTKAASKKNYGSTISYSTAWDDYYGDGYSKDAYITQVDYKTQSARRYENNPLLTNTNSVHVSLENLVNNKDYYLSLKESTGINSITVELKGDGGPLFYESEVAKEYLSDPDAAMEGVVLTKEELADLMQEFRDHGYYMIGRIVTFKDSVFAKQNKKESITDEDNKLVEINEEYWPSVYSRKAWRYNVAIAKEVAECNVNEVQFDYCRFPDGTASMSEDLDMKNTYNESKVAAIQGFLIYATDELESYEVYVGADIFAWPVVVQDDQDIGQFLPAIANVVDVVSPMPYTDLFSSGAMDISDPTAVPGETLYEFTKRTKQEMDEIDGKALIRNWIQGYGGFDADDIKAQIKGINKAGYEGYIVWYGNGDPDDLKSIQKGFIDSKIAGT